MVRWAAGASIVVGLLLLGGAGVRSIGDLPHTICSGRLWLPAEGSVASFLVADHRSASGCDGQTPNNATATRAVVTVCATAAGIASLSGTRARRRPLAIVTAVIGTAFVVALVGDVAVDAPPLSSGLVAAGSLLGIVSTVRSRAE